MPSTDTAQSLLALPAEVTQPDPYRVFGLAAGERDAEKISQAIRQTVARLQAAKPTADPRAWQQAATWVKQARTVLADPAQKARQDQAARQPVSDPLSGLLPGSGGTGAAPSAAPIQFRAGTAQVLPPTQPVTAHPPAAAVDATPAIDPFGINPPLPPSLAAQLAAAPEPVADAAPDVDLESLPIQVPKPEARKVRRRSRTPWAAISLGGLTLASLSGIVALLYVLNRNPAGITINLQTGPPENHESISTNAPSAPERQPPADPVMGNLAVAPPRPSRRDRANAEQLAAADNWLANLNHQDGDELPSTSMQAAADGESEEEPAMTAEQAMSPTPTSEMPQPASAPMEESTAASMETAESAEQAIEKAQQAIATADWSSMHALAEAAEQAAVTPEQKTRAGRLLQLAELASYYHGGVEKGLDGLEGAESFAVTEQIHVVVVEINQEKVIVKFNGRNKEYPRRELPLVLAHRIARLAMPADAPETRAAEQAYQAIAPISTPQYRQQAIRTLEAMTEPVEGANPVDVAAAIRDVFAE